MEFTYFDISSTSSEGRHQKYETLLKGDPQKFVHVEKKFISPKILNQMISSLYQIEASIYRNPVFWLVNSANLPGNLGFL